MRSRLAAIGAVTAYTAAVIVTVVVVLSALRDVERLTAERGRLRHTSEVIRKLQDVLTDLIDVETGERGFVITGDRDYLAPYVRGQRLAWTTLGELRALTTDSPTQQARLEQMVPLVEQKLTHAAATVAARERSDHAAAALSHASGKREMDATRALIDQMRAEEERLLVARRSEAEGVDARVRMFVGSGLCLAFGLVIMATWLGAANYLRRRRAQDETSRLQQIVELQALRDDNARFQEHFVGILGHDLRNPLNAILIGASALKRHPLAEADALTVARVEAAANRMSRMVGQLLDLTRTRAGGGIAIHPEPVVLGDLVRQVVDELEVANPDRRVALEVGGDTKGEWDPDRLGQVVSNLVGNAVQYGAPDQPIDIVVDGRADGVRLSVHNGGDPIDAETLPTLFDPYRRGPQQRRGGLGLGLYIARQVVLAHHGSLDASSTRAEGTTFTVRLAKE